jgi:UDP-2,3-diacylglucosamine hydrolase
MNKAGAVPGKGAKSGAHALFVSDLHLQAAMPHTVEMFFAFLRNHARFASQLYLLGDIFEYWAGDDDLDPFNRRVIEAIRAVSDSKVEVFWLSGNRDFLVGESFVQACGMTLLPDPYVTEIAGQRLVLTHGDALCTDDLAYMAFRAEVRKPEWQNEFLAQSLERRKAIIAGLRQGSRDAQREKADYIMDVNAQAVRALFDSSTAMTMIHGHTHRPAKHVTQINDMQCTRYVLTDWDCDVEPHRGGWIAIKNDGIIERVGLDALIAP